MECHEQRIANRFRHFCEVAALSFASLAMKALAYVPRKGRSAWYTPEVNFMHAMLARQIRFCEGSAATTVVA